MNVISPKVCWICQLRPARTSEHRFKATDVRLKIPTVTQRTPIYLQRGGKATNVPIGSAKSKALTFAQPICDYCNNVLTQPYDKAWEVLSEDLQCQWSNISRRQYFDLSKPFPGCTRMAAKQVHLYFVKLFGCKLIEDNVPIDLAPFSKALVSGMPHPEVSILVCNCNAKGKILMWDSEVHAMKNQNNEIHGAVWMYLVYPVAIKVGYIKNDASLYLPGSPWHPNKPGKLVKLSPFYGGTEPSGGRKAFLD